MLIKDLLKAGARKAQLTRMGRILTELMKRGINTKQLQALELFANSGESHVKDYAPWVSTLEMWEIDPAYEKMLRRSFPLAKVKITDSYEEIKSTHKKYDLIIVDNGTSIYGGHCEHFDLFPDIFRIAADSSILILNVIPEADHAALKEFPYLFHQAQLIKRQDFYKTTHPEKISVDEMLKVYKELIDRNGFGLEWHFLQKRSFVYYLVLKIRKLEFNS